MLSSFAQKCALLKSIPESTFELKIIMVSEFIDK